MTVAGNDVARRSLEQYVPRIATEWELDAPDRLWQERDATLCFVDISGFTNLSERLSRLGRIGAEELTVVLNRVFSTMLELAYEQQGSLLKFGGDALLLLFTGEDHAMRAVSAAIEMRRALRSVDSDKTRVGRLHLRMSVGVHSGPIHLFKAGKAHYELVVTGPGGTSTTEMEKWANPGEIVISSGTKERLPGSATSGPRYDGWLLRWRKPPEGGGAPVVRRTSDSDGAAEWVPEALRDYLLAADPEPEHRIATVGFIRFCETDRYLEEEGPDAVAERIDNTISAIQQAAETEGVTFLASDINEDGGKVILVAGAPTAQEDDEGRMLRTVRQIVDRETALHVHIGVNRGHVFAGGVGTPYRTTYTVMGDTVNVAARLAAAAPADEIYAMPAVLEESRTLFAADVLAPLSVKGKDEPLQAYAIGEETGDRGIEVQSELPFVGRDEELAEIRSVAGELESGRGGVVTIVGDTGTGKSRLAKEALADANDVAVLALRAEPYGTANPYRVFRDPVRAMLGVERGGAAKMVRQLEAGVAAINPDLAPLAPLLGDLAHVEMPPTPESAAIEPQFRRDRLAEVFIGMLERLDERGLVIAMEDAHWADEASSHLLQRLADQTADHPWLLVTTRRDGEDGFDPATGSRLEMVPLAEDHARELVILATAATPLRPHDVDAIVQRSGGNPFFLGEILRIVRDTGSTDGLPDSLGSVVGTKIDGLPTLSRLVLRYCSVLGRSFRTSVVDDILAEDELALDASTRSTLAEFLVADGSGRLRFRHDMVRDVAYNGLSFRRRQALHLRAGAVTEQMAGNDTDSVADVLAMHYSLGRDHDRAWEYGRIAGDRAREAYANDDAAVQYERALDAARQLEACPNRDLVAVWTHLGDVREQAGRFDAAFEAYRAASRLAKDDAVNSAELHLKRARARERAGSYSTALREVTSGRRLIEDLETSAAEVAHARLLSFGAAIRQAQDRPTEALRMAQVAADAARAANAQGALARAYDVMDWAYHMTGRPELAVYAADALRIYEKLGDLAMQATEMSNLGAEAYFSGNWSEALDFYERAAAAASRAGNSALAALAQSNAGEVWVSQGRFAEAVPLLRDALQVLLASGVLDQTAFAEVQLARAYCAQGRFEEADELLRLAKAQAEELGKPSFVLEAGLVRAEMQICLGEPEHALETMASVQEAVGPEIAEFYRVSVARVRATALAATGDLQAAKREASAALEATQGADLDFDTALLILTLSGIDGAEAPDQPVADPAVAMRLLASLGVERVPVPLPDGDQIISPSPDP